MASSPEVRPEPSAVSALASAAKLSHSATGSGTPLLAHLGALRRQQGLAPPLLTQIQSTLHPIRGNALVDAARRRQGLASQAGLAGTLLGQGGVTSAFG